MFERRHPFVAVVFRCLAIFAVADDRSLVAVIFFIRFHPTSLPILNRQQKKTKIN